jgi:hypothetical protein
MAQRPEDEDGWQTATSGRGGARSGGRGAGRGRHANAQGGAAQSPSGGASQKNWREHSNSRLPSALLAQGGAPGAQQAQSQAQSLHAQSPHAQQDGAAAPAAAAPAENLPPRYGVVRSNEEGTVRIVNAFDVFRDPTNALRKGDVVDLNTRVRADVPFEAEGWDSAGCIAVSMDEPGEWGVFLLQSKCTEDFLAWYYPVLKKCEELPELTESQVAKWTREEVAAVADWTFPMISAAQAENINACAEEAKEKYRAVARVALAKARSDEAFAEALEANAEARFWEYVGGRVKKCRCIRNPHESHALCTALLHFDKEMEPFPEGTCEMLDAMTFDLRDHGIPNVKRLSLFCIPLKVLSSAKDTVRPTGAHDFNDQRWFSLNDLAEGKENLQFRSREAFSLADSRRFFAELLAHAQALHGNPVRGAVLAKEEAAAPEESEDGKPEGAGASEEEEEEEDDILERMMSLGKPKTAHSDKRN